MIVAGIAADLIGCNRQRLHRRGYTFMEVLRDLAWDILTLGTYHRTARLKAVCMFEYSSDTKCQFIYLCFLKKGSRASGLGILCPLFFIHPEINHSKPTRRMSRSSLMKMCFRKKREKSDEGTIGYCIIVVLLSGNLSAAIGIGLIWVELRWSSHGKPWLVTTLIPTFSVLFYVGLTSDVRVLYQTVFCVSFKMF